MKKIIMMLIASLLMLPSHMMADSYTVLWKQYERAQQKDLPKTSMNVLKKIITKAQADKRYGHLLKAELLHGSLANQVSPDSLTVEVERLVANMQKAEKQDPVLAAVYQSSLGRLYRENAQLSDNSKELSEEYYRKSLSYPDLLAAHKASEYVPMVIEGIDSKIFGNDLLHVLGMEAEAYGMLHDYYQKQHNRPAACITALLRVRQDRDEDVMQVRKSKYLLTIDSLIDHYKDLPVAGELAIERYRFMEQADDASAESKMNYINYALTQWGAWPRMNILRNAKARLTLPMFHLSLGESVQIPHQERQVVIMQMCNINQLDMSVWRLNLKGDTSFDPNDPRDYAKIKSHIASKTPEYTASKRYVGLPDYQVMRDRMTIKGLPIGVYLVEMTTNNKSIKPQRALLRVSDMYLMSQTLPNNRVRLVAVSATTGQPLPNAKIRITNGNDYDNKRHSQTLTCNAQGEAVYEMGRSSNQSIYPYTDEDQACSETYFNAYGLFPKDRVPVRPQVELYTDRSIYRPGQTVHAAAIVYRRVDDERTEAIAHQTMTLTLRDANYKIVATKEVVTDDFGTASSDFVLPSSGLTGMFSLRTNFGNNGYESFSVEEYKRPTFQVSFDEVKEKYQAGETVNVVGHVKSFAGVPVQSAKVKYTVVRRPAMWWFHRMSKDREVMVAKDTLVTDGDGRFTVPVPMEMPDDYSHHVARYYSFEVHVDVTDAGGESHSAETRLPLSDKPTLLTCNLPAQSLRDSIPSVTFRFINNAGQPVDGQVNYTIDGHAYSVKTNEPTVQGLKNLSSGEHHLVAICGNDTLDQKFVIFSLDDKKPVVNTSDFFYVTSDTFPHKGKPVYLLFGSSDMQVHVVYTMIAGDRVIDSGTLEINNQLIKKKLTYLPQYDKGLLVNYAWVKNGKLYSHRQMIQKPQPDKRLMVTWKTFRNRLAPGQKEEWMLQITKPDGSPAQAQLMAVLFDQTLNEIRKHDWRFNTTYHPALPFTQWSGLNFTEAVLYGDAPIVSLRERELDFSRFDDVFASFDPRVEVLLAGYVPGIRIRGTRAMKAMPLSAMAKQSGAMVLKSTAGGSNAREASDDDAASPALAEPSQPQQSAPRQSVRENLSETAFFFPALLSDDKGNVSLRFTLPESVTTWQFMGLAHDKAMRHGMLKDEIVAQKTVMVQPNMPRFVRMGDHATLSARIISTSKRVVEGTVQLELLNPETEGVVFSRQQSCRLQPDTTVSVAFDFDVNHLLAAHPQLSLLIARVTVSGKGYSDGEQHYLPILPAKEWVTTTVPFTQHAPGTKTIDLKQLFPVDDAANRLTIEYTNNPAWLMVQALPSMGTPDADNAISLAAAYYANSIGRYLLNEAPQLKSTISLWKQEKGSETSLMSSLEKNQSLKTMVLEETPWVADANRESEQKQQLVTFFDPNSMDYRLNSALDKLSKLQNPAGSFSWWKGMSGSRYMTTAVVKMLVRLNALIGKQQVTTSIIRQALAYLDKKAAEEVAQLKELKAKGNKNLSPSEAACDYLYIHALAERPSTATVKYLVDLLAKKPSALTIYGKANSAIILSQYGKNELAKEYLQSINEYSVYKEEMGRYFDTSRAQYTWCDYRIPSQVAAIEATKRLRPGDPSIEEMQRWLLQSKRTQAWDTPINSVNAVFAFLHGATEKLTQSSQDAVIKIDNQPVALPKATAGLGYVKVSKPGKDVRTLAVSKTSAGTSWGAVYAQFMQKSTEVASLSSGIKVTRTLLYNGKPATNLKVGDRVTVRIEIEADRDYDFVQLQDKRAACLEPIGQLSGYHQGYYCAPKDNATNYYFDRLGKGKHRIETDYYIDRAGTYQTGICTIQCAYSPEYNGREAAKTLNIQ
ncbi:MAG: alpha-2-macroglobulin family protein [Prevotella sp.]|nr:alpha-2-macroglobulin family protein [Prevotellaceae bacterium]MDY5844372.1 alpha-2-macroglobulin family protein [Prevotella sp.]